VEHVCSQHSVSAAGLVGIAKLLEQAQSSGGNGDIEGALRALDRLLESAVACSGLHAPPLLGVLTRSLMLHPALLAGVQRLPAFMRDARALLARRRRRRPRTQTRNMYHSWQPRSVA
jgi:hypothetical protein